MPMIACSNLTKIYGDIVAVDDMTFEISSGECVGLLGLNGAGKTTLLRIMSCLLTPSSGSMIVGGADVIQAPERVRPKIGYLPEDPPLYGEMTVRRFLEFASRLRDVPAADVDSRISEVSARCELDGVLHQRIETLSYGFKKRVGIAQAVVHGPPLVILDEPIAGLDPAQIVGIRDLIRSLTGDHTVVISSHILTEISQICNRILVVHQGRIVASGSEEELSKKLSGRIGFSVKVKGSAEQVSAALQDLPDISSYKVVRDEGGVLTLDVLASAHPGVALSRALVHGGLGLMELYTRQDKLESVFLDLTGKKAEEERP